MQVKDVLLWLWQFPQNILAFIIYKCLLYWSYPSGKYYGKYVIYNKVILSSFCLGEYLFMRISAPENVVKHEFGHSKQSEILGWLYIPAVAIPSIVLNIYCRIARKLGYNPDYYSHYPERWANKLAEKYII